MSAKREGKKVTVQRDSNIKGGRMIKAKAQVLMLMICFWAGAMAISACNSQQLQLVKMGDLYIEPIPSAQVTFSDITAKQEGDELVISGEVSRRNTSFSGAGYVDVAVVSPGGMVIDKASIPYTPRILPKTPGARSHHPSHFEGRLRCTPPQWSIIRIAYHAQAVPGDLKVDEGNLALPEDYDYGG